MDEIKGMRKNILVDEINMTRICTKCLIKKDFKEFGLREKMDMFYNVPGVERARWSI